ncbi:MAG: hypothetical protein ACYDEJ_09565 [Desulfitobacteriaceae bacterium]
MIVNELDKCIYDLLQNSEGAAGELQKFRALLEDLCEELKQVWQGNVFMDRIVAELIDNCLCYATSPLEEHEWDDMKADKLIVLFSSADQSRDLRDAVSWADRSRDVDILILLKKLEAEKRMIFINDSLENLDGMAYRTLAWLNARSSLIQAYQNR